MYIKIEVMFCAKIATSGGQGLKIKFSIEFHFKHMNQTLTISILGHKTECVFCVFWPVLMRQESQVTF